MTWSRFDDGYDEHEKIEEAWHAFPPNPIGLHVLATTACNRWLSDGVIRPRWLAKMLPRPADQKRILAFMVDQGLFDLLPAGQTRTVVDQAAVEIELGPFPEDRYVVHDFLDRHDSGATIKARRAKDAARKAGYRRAKSYPESTSTPDGVRADVRADGQRTSAVRPPHARARGRAPASRPDPTRPDLLPPSPPASRGSQTNGARRGSRTNGTNPRALALAAAAEVLEQPSVDQQAKWQSLRAAMQRELDGNDVGWHLHVSRTTLAGVDADGTLVINADGTVRMRYERWMTAVAATIDVPARLVTDQEHAALQARTAA